jgi:ribosomal protein S27AE
MHQFKAGTKIVYLGKSVASLLELMALPDDQLYLADEPVTAPEETNLPKGAENVPDGSDAINNVLKEFEGKEIDTAVLLERLRPFIKAGDDILAKLYEDGRLDYRMDRIYIKPHHESAPEMMKEVPSAPIAPFDPTKVLGRVAKVNRAAGESLFLQNVLKCPNCGSNMKIVKLVGSVDSWFCGNCRHCDFSDKVKSSSHSNIRTVDKILEFRCLDSGNCEITN